MSDEAICSLVWGYFSKKCCFLFLSIAETKNLEWVIYSPFQIFFFSLSTIYPKLVSKGFTCETIKPLITVQILVQNHYSTLLLQWDVKFDISLLSFLGQSEAKVYHIRFSCGKSYTTKPPFFRFIHSKGNSFPLKTTDKNECRSFLKFPFQQGLFTLIGNLEPRGHTPLDVSIFIRKSKIEDKFS